MTIFNREDYRTVLPQLEKRITALENEKRYSPVATYIGLCTSKTVAEQTIADTATAHVIPDFLGWTVSHPIIDTKYFAPTDRGIIVKRRGVYRLSVVTHINSTTSDASFYIWFHDYKRNTTRGRSQYNNKDCGWASISDDWICDIDANSEIGVQCARYAGSSKWRWTACYFTIELIQEL